MSKRAVRQYSWNGKFIAEYSCIKDAADSTDICGSAISSVCRGKTKTAGHYIWRYADEFMDGQDEDVQGIWSFQDEFPKLVKEWSPKNSRGPDQYTPRSKKKVLWVCPAGHPGYLMSLRLKALGHGCPKCAQLPGRKVCQYSKSGKLIRKYASITEAARETGIWKGNIGKACRDKNRTAGNCFWRYADEVSGKAGRKQRPHMKKTFLSEYPELAKEWSPENTVGPDEVNPHAYSKVLWNCPEGHPDYWMSPHNRALGVKCPVCGRLSMQQHYKTTRKPVYQMDGDGIIIAKYPSLSAASLETGIPVTMITSVCRGRQKTSGGFRWRYADKEEDP